MEWKVEITYDTFVNEREDIHYLWSNTGWSKNQKIVYQFDASNRVVNQEIYFWVDAWMGYIKRTYDYTSMPAAYASVMYRWVDTIWVNNLKTVYTYTAHGNGLTYESFNWVTESWNRHDHNVSY